MRTSELFSRFCEAFRPPKDQTVSEWADENRILVSESSSAPGRWRTDFTPYQKEIMDSFTDPNVERIVVMTSAQVGKTEIMLNAMMRAIDVDPGPMVYVNATTLFSEDFSKRRFAPAVKVCPRIAEKLGEARSRDSSNTITMKTFPGGSVAFIGATSPVELAGRPIRYVFGDEIDRWPLSAGAEGDPISLVERRAETFRNRKFVYVSTPTIKAKDDGRGGRIHSAYLLGTQEQWRVKCPGCGRYHYTDFADLSYEYDEVKANGETLFKIHNLRWKCPECGRELRERELKNQPAKWVAQNPGALKERKTRSFQLNALISPWARWVDIVREFLEAGKDYNKLQAFYNTRLGEPWERVDVTNMPDRMMARREEYECDVPDGALVLTMGLDTQDDRIVYEVVGWGQAEESWGIRFGTIPGRADDPYTWERVENVLGSVYRRSDGRPMKVACAFMDSGGHFTADVYKQTMRRRAMRIFPVKGETGEDKQYVRMSRAKRYDDGMILFLIAVDSGKAAIMYNAAVEEWGANYMHFPSNEGYGYDKEYFRSLFSERVEEFKFRGKTRLGWHKIYDRNEALDVRNYARAAFKAFDWRLDAIEARYRAPDPAKQPHDVREAMARPRKKSAYLSKGVTV